MKPSFTKNIGPYINIELVEAKRANYAGEVQQEFKYLERAHVLGQESTYWHVKVHLLMLLWAVRNRIVREILGQLFRILGAATKTAIGLVPQGNTGGTNVSPFRKMPISPDLAVLIQKARSET